MNLVKAGPHMVFRSKLALTFLTLLLLLLAAAGYFSLKYVHNLSLSRRSSFANSILPMRNLQSANKALNHAEIELLDAVMERAVARGEALSRFQAHLEKFESRFDQYQDEATHEQTMQELLARYGALQRQSSRQQTALEGLRKSYAQLKEKMDEVVLLLRAEKQQQAEANYHEALPLFTKIDSQVESLMSLEVEDGEYLDRESQEVAKAADRQIPVIATFAMALGFLLVLVVARSVERERTSEKLQQAKDAAEAANRAKSDFLARMSHEIRTPMNGVMGALDVAMRSDAPPESREYMELARTSADDLLRVIDDILDFSKIESGMLQFEAIHFNLRKRVSDALAVVQTKASEKGLTLNCHVDRDVPESVVGDPGRLRQIVLNLVGNAIKFTECGSVTLNVQQQARTHQEVTLHFFVRDTGIGIPAERRGYIFMPFEQADASTTRKHGGTGLGLAIASQLVDTMGGSMWVESELGKGSTFHFTVRLGFSELTQTKAAICGQMSPTGLSGLGRPLRNNARSARILLAEDNPINQKILRRVLEDWSYSVTVVANGRDAIAQLEENSFDLVLMDVQMPEMDGFETTAVIRELEEGIGKRIPIIAITAHAMKDDRQRCLNAGMDNYVSKPINLQLLFERIKASLNPAGESGSQPMSAPFSRTVTETREPVWLNSERVLQQASFVHSGEEPTRANGHSAFGEALAIDDEIASIFLTDTPHQLADLQAAVSSANTERVKEVSHYLNSSATFVGAHRMRRLCESIVVMADTGKLADITPAAEELSAEAMRACAAVDKVKGNGERNITLQRFDEESTNVPAARIRILIVDDHPIVRTGVRNLLRGHASIEVVGDVANGLEAIATSPALKPDVILLDLVMPELSGIEVLRELAASDPEPRVILLAASIERQQLFTALQLGARGVVQKSSSAEDLARAIQVVHAGEYWVGQEKVGDLISALDRSLVSKRANPDSFGLTPRELQILPAIVEGCTNKDIAGRFSITEDTVKRHLTNIFDKLGVSSRLELGMFAIHHELVERT